MQRRLMRASLLALILLVTGLLPVMAQTSALDERLADLGQGALVGVRDDVFLAAGETADAVVVVQADARIEGTTETLVLIDGTAVIEGVGSGVDQVFAVGGTLTVGAGATVGDIRYFETEVTVDQLGTVTGEQRDLATDVAWIFGAFALFFFLLWIGFGIALLVWGVLTVAFATSQARRSAWLIGNHPFKVLGAGFLFTLVLWLLIVLLSITVVGLPIAFGLGLAWWFVAFAGYLVAGLWVGERVLRSSRNAARPYAGVLVGLIILLLLSWIPLVTFIATWFGMGAVTMAGWRVLRGGTRPGAAPPYGQPYPYVQPVPPPAYAPPPYAPPPYAPPGQAPEQWPAQDRWPPQQPPTNWPG